MNATRPLTDVLCGVPARSEHGGRCGARSLRGDRLSAGPVRGRCAHGASPGTWPLTPPPGRRSTLSGQNCWTFAEHGGHADPWCLQHRFDDCVCDEDAVRDNAAAAGRDQIASAPERVLMVDQTGDPDMVPQRIERNPAFNAQKGRDAALGVFHHSHRHQG